MNKTAISANNAFLTNVGLIEGGRSKAATDEGRDLAKALEHELPDEIQDRWAAVVGGNDFLEKMAAAVKVRGKMESAALESHIAYSAGEAKSGPVMTGARAVVDILRAAGVVRESEGQLVAGGRVKQPLQSAETSVSLSATRGAPSDNTTIGVASVPVPSHNSDALLRIELRIDAKPSELDGLGEKIRKLIQDIEKPEERNNDPSTNKQ